MLEPLEVRLEEEEVLFQCLSGKSDREWFGIDPDSCKGARLVRSDLDDPLEIRDVLELERARAGLGALSDKDVAGVRADNDCPVRAKRDVLYGQLEPLPRPMKLTFTAVNRFLNAQINCGLTVTCRSLPSLLLSSIGFGKLNVKTSPMDERAAKVLPQQVTFLMDGLSVD